LKALIQALISVISFGLPAECVQAVTVVLPAGGGVAADADASGAPDGEPDADGVPCPPPQAATNTAMVARTAPMRSSNLGRCTFLLLLQSMPNSDDA
jgi:hypothetical protein